MSQEKKNVLVLGASGGVGSMVYRELQSTERYNIIGTYYNNPKPGLIRCNICVPEDLKRIFGEKKPDAVLVYAGLAQEKLCRDNPEKTYKVNVQGAENIVRQAEIDEVPLLYPSTINTLTGYNNGEICTEETKPLAKTDSIYGQSKIQVENIVQNSSLISSIPRTDLVLDRDYGIAKLFKDNGFAKIMINALRFPIYIKDYSKYLQLFIDNPIKHTGIIHLLSPEFQNGSKLTDVADVIIKRFNLAKSTIIVPNATEFIPRTNEYSPMPIYITPTANDNLPNFVFTSTRL
jgi:dTDP-4-dehydrorhamnose reductase